MATIPFIVKTKDTFELPESQLQGIGHLPIPFFTKNSTTNNKMRTINQILDQHRAIEYNPLLTEKDYIQVGDYVFATKYLDASPNDRWRIDIIDRIEFEGKAYMAYFFDTGVIPFKYCTMITKEEGDYLLQYYSMCEIKLPTLR